METGLSGKRALVLGGSKGIGRGIAEGLAAEGARVILASRDGGVCAAVAQELASQYGAEIHGTACDMADMAGCCLCPGHVRGHRRVGQQYGGATVWTDQPGRFRYLAAILRFDVCIGHSPNRSHPSGYARTALGAHPVGNLYGRG